MPNPVAFRPRPASTQTLAATTGSGRVQFQTGLDTPHIRVYNAGTSAVFIELGGATVSAANTGMPLGPNESIILASSATHLAAICGTGTATLYVTPGYGGA